MTEDQYSKLFDPDVVEKAGAEADLHLEALTDSDVYVFDDPELILAVNAALAASAPLLLYGPPGSGKSSLAANIARILGVRYFSEVITHRTESRDLLWKFDAVQRLSDAQVGHEVRDYAAYCKPGVLWRAFASDTAVALGSRTVNSVVLLDEIDKADPDLPNGLLVPLGSLEFEGPSGDPVVPAHGSPLVIITSNSERELSRAFVRRCIVAHLRHPTASHLVKVATARLGPPQDQLYDQVALLVGGMLDARASEKGPSTAEYLDCVRACTELRITPGDDVWNDLERIVLRKSGPE